MKIQTELVLTPITPPSPSDVLAPSDVLVVPVASDVPAQFPAERLISMIQSLKGSGEFNGQPNELLTLYDSMGTSAKKVVLVGVGEKRLQKRSTWNDAIATAVRSVTTKKVDSIAIHTADLSDDCLLGAIVGAGISTVPTAIRRKESGRFSPRVIHFLVQDNSSKQAVLNRGKIEAEAISLARELVNLPPNELYPETFAAIAQQLGSECGISCEVWDDSRLRAEGMHALVGVGQGSIHPSRLVILRYFGGGQSSPIAYVGKGVTFDSGGLSLKTTDQMVDMKCDMAGAAVVLSTLTALAKLKAPINAIGIMALAENMPSSNALKLGDVIRARNGKTIEILNTDAEGRVILADALSYAAEQKPAGIVDLATLTGACLIALGTEIAGLMTNHQNWGNKVKLAAENAGERVWQLPMDRDFEEGLKSKIADLRNAPPSRYGGAILGGKFLEQFVNGLPWVHLDIAGPAWTEKESPSRDSGGTGAMVRTMIELGLSLT